MPVILPEGKGLTRRGADRFHSNGTESVQLLSVVDVTEKPTRRKFQMARKKTTRITIERDQVLIIRESHAGRRWCSQCGAEVDAVSAEEIDSIIRRTSRSPGQGLSNDSIHLLADGEGDVRICLNSLRALMEPKR